MTFQSSLSDEEIQEATGPLGETLAGWYKRSLFDKVDAMWRNKLAAAVAAEREACAKLCDARVEMFEKANEPWAHHHIDEAKYLSICIRSRNHHEKDADDC